MTTSFDLAVVGAGILGLAHALAAARLGKKVVVLDREPQAIGASVRHAGLVSVTGQQRGPVLDRARRSREIWAAVAPAAGIAIEQRGLIVAARRPEAVRTLEAFLASDPASGCELITPQSAKGRLRHLKEAEVVAALWSPHELRLEARTAIPKLARWLAERYGVEFQRATQVLAVAPPRLDTSAGLLRAHAVVVCPGEDLLTLFAARLATYKATRCRLQMLRIAPGRRLRLPATLMSDLSLLGLPAFAELPEGRHLRTRLESGQRDAAGSRLMPICVQSADGSLVVGQSHHFSPAPEPFSHEPVDRLILAELERVLDLGAYTVLERWSGSYPAADRPVIVDRPGEAVRVVVAAGGAGFSLAFGLAEEVIADLLACPLDEVRAAAVA